jgi:hypothetical protein
VATVQLPARITRLVSSRRVSVSANNQNHCLFFRVVLLIYISPAYRSRYSDWLRDGRRKGRISSADSQEFIFPHQNPYLIDIGGGGVLQCKAALAFIDDLYLGAPGSVLEPELALLTEAFRYFLQSLYSNVGVT